VINLLGFCVLRAFATELWLSSPAKLSEHERFAIHIPQDPAKSKRMLPRGRSKARANQGPCAFRVSKNIKIGASSNLKSQQRSLLLTPHSLSPPLLASRVEDGYPRENFWASGSADLAAWNWCCGGFSVRRLFGPRCGSQCPEPVAV
jgi:hypothetical protein